MKLKFIVALGLLAAAISTQAATLFVKTTGDDTKACSSWAEACKTIAHAVSVAAAGDTLYIAKGIYKPDSPVTIASKSLNLIGGFTDGNSSISDDKFATVISGDIDNDDIVDSRGITLLAADINGNNTVNGFTVSDGDYSFQNLTLTGFKNISADAHGIAIFYSDSGQTENRLSLDNVAIIGNYAPSMGNVMMYVLAPNQGTLVVENSLFEGNVGDAGSALTAHQNVTEVLVENTVFDHNAAEDVPGGWSNHAGALYIDTTVANVSVKNSIFSHNTALLSAGAIVSNSPISIVNSSFSDNTVTADSSGACAGALRVNNQTLSLQYNTFYQNAATANSSSDCAGAISADISAANSVVLLANLILANTPNNITVADGAMADKGFNLFGADAVSGIAGSFALASSSQVPTVAASAIVVGAGAYGGRGDSVKIVKNGLAYNAVPNDGIGYYGVGKSAQAPFVSLKQARSALSREDYSAGLYYFDLGGSYDANDNQAFIAGDGTLAFAASIDAQAWVNTAGLSAAQQSVLNGQQIEQKTVDGDVWLLGDIGLCAGAIPTDARGLPRSDKVAEDEAISSCDIGAFEYNDFYQVDCADEDGMRFDNSLNEVKINWCVHPNDLTPDNIVDNLGAFGGYWNLVLWVLIIARRKCFGRR